jgi:hypothetical protein
VTSLSIRGSANDRSREIQEWLDTASTKHAFSIRNWIAIDDTDLAKLNPKMFENRFIQVCVCVYS